MIRLIRMILVKSTFIMSKFFLSFIILELWIVTIQLIHTSIVNIQMSNLWKTPKICIYQYQSKFVLLISGSILYHLHVSLFLKTIM